MITLKQKTNYRRLLWLFRTLLILSTLSIPLQPGFVRARQAALIETVDLDLSSEDITRVEFGYHYSSFESSHTEYKLEVKDGLLTDGKVKVPVSTLNKLLSGLHEMYPGTRPLTWQSWTDDYPFAWVNLHLKDGRVVRISSDSQFTGMYPWNVSLWGSEDAVQPDAMYIQLQPALLAGIDKLWRGVGEGEFPRGSYDESFWKDMFGDPPPETVLFNIPADYSPDVDDSATAPVWGAGPDSLNPFLPALSQNNEIKSLVEAGYSLYDAAFTLEVDTQTLKPVGYSGMLALAAPGETDVVVGQATIPVEDGQPVTTTLVAEDSMRLVDQRQTNVFLSDTARLLKSLKFLLDTRKFMEEPSLDCPKGQNTTLAGSPIQAIWDPVEPMRLTFYPLIQDRWAVDLAMRRGDLNWTDPMVQAILKAWFPAEIAALPIQDILSFDTAWGLALKPDVTLRDPQLLDRLKASLPEQVVVHEQNPEKEGDYSFLSFAGRSVIPGSDEEPETVYCGIAFPDWYGPEHSIENVRLPSDQASRKDMPGGIGKSGEWRTLSGPLPSEEQYSTQWTDIAFSKPGYLHVLWTEDYGGVYYSEGWIDGTGWTSPQRLDDDSYWLDIRAWPDGEVHLFWDAGLRTGGTFHVWRSADGTWHRPEHWTSLSYFGEILRDSDGVLHIGSVSSDGLDYEFMHWTWSAEEGLSDPENISRRSGDGGSSGILRFDTEGQLHAAWSHILTPEEIPDPLTGETSDISGVFYARRLPDGRWSTPEQVGTLAPYAHALGMELDGGDYPLIVWQADSGLVSRTKRNGVWEEQVELEAVVPPETPAEFGPDRWVQPTAELQTGVDPQGGMVVGWLIPETGLRMATWAGGQWTNPIEIFSNKENITLSSEAPEFEMVVDPENHVHFTYFVYEFTDLWSYASKVVYADYDQKTVETYPLTMAYDGYGLPVSSLKVDTAGSVAVMGLPRSPGFAVKLPASGIPPTPSPTPSPTVTPLPTFTPEKTPTPTRSSAVPVAPDNTIPLLIGMIAVVVLIILAVGLIRSKRH
jgi:hypothetical protein